MHQTSATSYGDQPAIITERRVFDWPIRGEVALRNFDMLPDVGLWVDDAHIWLVRAAVHKNAVVHLQECITRVVLRVNGQPRHVADLHLGSQARVGL